MKCSRFLKIVYLNVAKPSSSTWIQWIMNAFFLSFCTFCPLTFQIRQTSLILKFIFHRSIHSSSSVPTSEKNKRCFLSNNSLCTHLQSGSCFSLQWTALLIVTNVYFNSSILFSVIPHSCLSSLRHLELLKICLLKLSLLSGVKWHHNPLRKSISQAPFLHPLVTGL